MVDVNELDSTCGITDEELTQRFIESIRIDNEIKKIKGVPIAGYDTEKKRHFWNILMEGENMYPSGEIYDNSVVPYRIFKKRKLEYFIWSNENWSEDAIRKLIGIHFQNTCREII